MADRGPASEPVLAKKPYQKPLLQKLETIRQLTQGGKSAGGDVPGKKAAGS